MKTAPPLIKHIAETILYVKDIPRSAEFYARVLQFKQIFQDENIVTLQVQSQEVLILFPNEKISGVPEDGIPNHHGHGVLHVAFSIDANAVEAWENWLTHCGVSIESKKFWSPGVSSLYFRDPDMHVVELATPGIWPTA